MSGLIFLTLYLLAPLVAVVVAPLLVFRVLRRQSGAERIPILTGGIALVVGVIAFAIYMLHLIHQVRSSTGGLWVLALPLYSCIAGGIAFAVAWSLATVAVWVAKKSKGQPVPQTGQWVLAVLVLLSATAAFSAYSDSEFLARKGADASASVDTLRAVYRHPWGKHDRFVLAALAQNSACPPDVLLALAQENDPKLREKHQTFRDLMKNDFFSVHRHVAQNPNTPVEGLLVLARSPSSYVMAEVARNPRTPVAVLDDLAPTRDFIVPHSLAYNTNTSPEVLEKLSEHDNEYVRMGVAQNPKTASSVLARLSKDASVSVRESVALNPNTPPESLRTLSRDPSSRIKVFVASNPATPEDVLRVLVSETDVATRNYAESNLARKLREK